MPDTLHIDACDLDVPALCPCGALIVPESLRPQQELLPFGGVGLLEVSATCRDNCELELTAGESWIVTAKTHPADSRPILSEGIR